MSPEAHAPTDEALSELALGKLERVLGPTQGKRVYRETLTALGLSDLQTPDDLYRFGQCLARQGAIHGAVGGLLTVAAVLRGASAADS
jgi:hypothetical protein